MSSKIFENMKIAETILEFKESTKESQGDIFSRVMVSVAHGRNIGKISISV